MKIVFNQHRYRNGVIGISTACCILAVTCMGVMSSRRIASLDACLQGMAAEQDSRHEHPTTEKKVASLAAKKQLGLASDEEEQRSRKREGEIERSTCPGSGIAPELMIARVGLDLGWWTLMATMIFSTLLLLGVFLTFCQVDERRSG